MDATIVQQVGVKRICSRRYILSVEWTFCGLVFATRPRQWVSYKQQTLFPTLTSTSFHPRFNHFVKPRKGRVNLFSFYGHRYLRLTPAFAALILLFSTLMKYGGGGPIFATFNELQQDCADYWWTSLLYVQNYVNPERIVKIAILAAKKSCLYTVFKLDLLHFLFCQYSVYFIHGICLLICNYIFYRHFLSIRCGDGD